MKKHLANIISLSRVAGAIALFFFNNDAEYKRIDEQLTSELSKLIEEKEEF